MKENRTFYVPTYLKKYQGNELVNLWEWVPSIIMDLVNNDSTDVCEKHPDGLRAVKLVMQMVKDGLVRIDVPKEENEKES